MENTKLQKERAAFLDYWCEDVPEYMRAKWRESVSELLDTPNASDRMQSAWTAWQARGKLDLPAQSGEAVEQWQHRFKTHSGWSTWVNCSTRDAEEYAKMRDFEVRGLCISPQPALTERQCAAIQFAIGYLRNHASCEAEVDVLETIDTGNPRVPAQIETEANIPKPTYEPSAWVVYWGLGHMHKDSVHMEKQAAQEVASCIRSNTEVRPLFEHFPKQEAVGIVMIKNGVKTPALFTDSDHTLQACDLLYAQPVADKQDASRYRAYRKLMEKSVDDWPEGVALARTPEALDAALDVGLESKG